MAKHPDIDKKKSLFFLKALFGGLSYFYKKIIS